jgi:hypothetical protein
MPRTIRSALVLSAAFAVAALGSGCSTTVVGTAAAEGGAAAAAPATGDAVAWVDQVCGSLRPFILTTGSPPNPREATDPESLVANLSGFLKEAQDAAGAAIDGITDAGPAPVAGGDEIAGHLKSTLSTIQTTYRDAQERVDGVDVDDRAAVLREVPAAVQQLEQLSEIPNPIAGMQGSPELDAAAREAPNCLQIERDFGG